MDLLFDRLATTIERNLDYRLERANVISANLANVDTPGYTPVELDFHNQLGQVLRGELPVTAAKTHYTHIGPPAAQPRADVTFDYTATPDEDGNSVDLDREMAKLAENQLHYRASTVAYNRRMALLKYAMSEGNR